MTEKFSESIKTVYALASQIDALIELMMMCEESVDIKAIKTASEMCQTIQEDMMREVEKIEKEYLNLAIKCGTMQQISAEKAKNNPEVSEYMTLGSTDDLGSEAYDTEKLPGDYIEEMIAAGEVKHE